MSEECQRRSKKDDLSWGRGEHVHLASKAGWEEETIDLTRTLFNFLSSGKQ